MVTGSSSTKKSNHDPRMIGLTVGSVSYKALIDSGAMVNTVTTLVYEQIKRNSWSAIQNVIIHPTDTLKGYGSEAILMFDVRFMPL